MCKWFNPSQSWDPREGECKKPGGDAVLQTDEFKSKRHTGRLITDQKEAEKCPDFTPAGPKGKGRVQI